MEEIKIILGDFIRIFKDEIFNVYNRFYQYIKDILSEKKINLRRKTSRDDEKKRNQNLETMLEVLKIAFLTIGVPKKKLLEDTKKIKEIIYTKGDTYPDYNSYFEQNLKNYVDQVLFDILIEYLVDIDTIKMQNLDLFDLLPRNFIQNLKKFKEEKIKTTKAKELIKKEMLEMKESFVPTDFTTETEQPKEEIPRVEKVKAEEINQKNIKIAQEEKAIAIEEKTLIKEEPITPASHPEVLEQTTKKAPSVETKEKGKKENESVKEDSIVTVAEPKVLDQIFKKKPTEAEKKILEIKKRPPKKREELTIVQEFVPKKSKFEVPENPMLFLDYIGKFFPINYDIIDKFNVNVVNLIDSKDNDIEFFNLENLFYYITILKMLNIDLPLTSEELIKILKNFTNGKIFSANKESAPDPINIFYGLAILSELDLLYSNIDFINFMEIELFLESELKVFMPEKLHLNFFTILCLKLLKKSGGLIAVKTHLINSILNLDVFSFFKDVKDYNPLLDIFEHLAIIKILDKKANTNNFRALYTKELKKYITSTGYVNDTITDTSRALLIVELLDLKKTENVLCEKFLNIIINNSYFSTKSLKKRFNWKMDKIAYTIELRMLFWALLSCSQVKLAQK